MLYIDRVEATEARRAIPADATLRNLGEIFRVLGDPTRLKICLALQNHELCVSDIAAVAGISESAVSHQLRLLKAMRLVRYRKEGKMVYYMLDDSHIEQLISLGVRHVQEL
ncbi:MAG: metalloregulator ArsR/SmtB family transcription factor [Bacteroidota bacterium]